jgi:hypothetical protein
MHISMKSVRCVVTLVPLAAMLAGCVPQQARDGARVLAVYTNQVDGLLTGFAARQTAIDKTTQVITNNLEQSALTAQNKNVLELQKLTIAGDKQRTDFVAQIEAASEVTAAQQAAGPTTAPTKTN